MTTVEKCPPYAQMVGDEFDVSAYCHRPYVESLDHLTSFHFALFSIFRPGLKIAARSLFVENEEITLANIVSNLNSDEPISAPPPNARSQPIKRSLCHRVLHFIFIGIPFAIFIGLLAGILQFIRNIVKDLITVFNGSCNLYSMSQSDLKFYKENPQLLPPRGKLIDAIVNRFFGFYTFYLIDRKLGIFSCLVKPIVGVIVRFLTRRAIIIFDRIDNNQTRDIDQKCKPSVPLRPTTDEKSDGLKHD